MCASVPRLRYDHVQCAVKHHQRLRQLLRHRAPALVKKSIVHTIEFTQLGIIGRAGVCNGVQVVLEYHQVDTCCVTPSGVGYASELAKYRAH